MGEHHCRLPEQLRPRKQLTNASTLVRIILINDSGRVMNSQTPPSTPPANATACAEEAKHALDSRELFAGRQEVAIAHAGEIYRLRRTRQGKLILTK